MAYDPKDDLKIIDKMAEQDPSPLAQGARALSHLVAEVLDQITRLELRVDDVEQLAKAHEEELAGKPDAPVTR